MTADVLDGRFELQAPLGSGGMAAVYRAWDREGRRQCAVKVLADVLARDEEFRRRFRHEAASAGALTHPHIVRVYGWGQDGLRQFIAMEYVGGGTLRERLQRDGRLPEADALRIAAEVADALAYAHGRHVVHRDIKPHNILLTDDGHVKVADFGIARTLDSTSLTRTGTVMGSAPYVSPEQVRGDAAGPGSDQYALGIVLYEMLTGRVPFSGEAPVSVALKHLHEAPRSLRETSPDVSPATASVVERLLAKTPQDRYPDAGALAAELRRLAGAAPPHAAEEAEATVPPVRSHATRRSVDATSRIGRPSPPVDATARLDSAAASVDATTQLGSQAGSVEGTTRLDPRPAPVDATTRLTQRTPPVDRTARLDAAALAGAAARPGPAEAVAHTSSLAAVPAPRAAAPSDTAELRLPGRRRPTVFAARVAVAAVCVAFGLTVLAAAYRAAWVAAHVTVPNLVGRTAAEAGQRVQTLRLGVLVSAKRQDPKAPFGVIVAQDPPPGAGVAKGTVINLTVSVGSGVVPNLAGQTVQQASAMLERVGLRLGQVNYSLDDRVAQGRIIYQFQPAGTQLEPNGAVDVLVSQGQPAFPFLSPGPPGHKEPKAPEREHKD